MSQLVVKNLLISYSGFDEKVDNEKCLLFLHGWRSNKEIWQGIINQLPKDKYKVFVLDFPGFGASQIPSTSLTVGDYADLVAEFIKKLELKNVIVVGHSFGGRVGIKLSVKCPSLITQLVLVDSAGFTMDENKKMVMGKMAKIAKPFFKPNFMQPLRKKIYKQIGSEDYLATPDLQKTFVNITNEDLSPDLKNIKVPTLIINGKNDTDTPVAFGEKMQTLIPNSKFQVIENAGHFSFLDNPKDFLKILNDFI